MRTGNARLAAAALLVFVCALVALGAQWPPYSQWQHPVALAGAAGVPGARLFNAMVFVLPGALLALVALRLRDAVPAAAGWRPRIGAGLLLLSALAFAAQGLWPLDIGELDGVAGRRHVSAWTAWWIAFVAAASLLATASRRLWLPTLFAVAIVLLGVIAPQLAGIGLSQRAAFLAWFGWVWVAANALPAGRVADQGAR